MTELKITQNFKDWACSFSGCDGGNPESGIWLSGIEWGYGKEKSQTKDEYETALRNYYTKELPEEIAKGKYTPPDKYHWLERGTYKIIVRKLYHAIRGKAVKDYDGSEIFKMNLYPIAFRNTDGKLWKDWGLDKLTGFEEKELFKTWCFLHRFSFIREQVKK